MSIASRITEMETHISNAYTSIDNLGIDISNTNKNIYNISTLLDTFYESLPKVSGIGASLSLSPSMVGKIKLNEIQGDTLQNGTPTPSSPVPIQSVTGLQNVEVCGKNLINGLLDNSTTGKKLERTINADENFYLYIKTNNTTSDRCYAFLDSTNVGTIWVSNNNGTLTFSGSRNFTFNRIRIQDNTTVSENMLTLGSTATTYEPYKGNTYEVNLGKNLLPNLVTTQTKNGVEITKNSDGSLTFNNTATAGINLNINYASGSYIHLESGKKYTISITNNSGIYFRLAKVSDGTLVASFDTPAKQTTFTSSYTGDVFAYLTILNGTSFSNLTIYPQIEVGSQATTYSPYFTPIELNKIGDYEDSIKKSTGKNLFDKDNANILNAIINGTTGDITAFNTCRTAYIQCKPNTTYTISRIAGTRFIVGTTTNIPIIGSVCNQKIGDNTATSITITTGANDNYLCVFYYNSGSDTLTEEQIRNSIMINEGSTALPYEPYGKVWYITKNIQNWSTDSPNIFLINGSDGNAQSSPDGLFQIFTSNLFTNFRNETMLSSKFKYHYDSRIDANVSANTYLTDNTFCIRQGTNDRVYFKSSDLANKSKADVLSTLNSLDLSYVLSTPKYEVITNTELINQLESLYNAKSKNGTTNINVTSEDLSMILNVSVLKGDVE